MSVVLTWGASLAFAFGLLRQVTLPAALRRWLIALSSIALVSASTTMRLLWNLPSAIGILLLGSFAIAAGFSALEEASAPPSRQSFCSGLTRTIRCCFLAPSSRGSSSSTATAGWYPRSSPFSSPRACRASP